MDYNSPRIHPWRQNVPSNLSSIKSNDRSTLRPISCLPEGLTFDLAPGKTFCPIRPLFSTRARVPWRGPPVAPKNPTMNDQQSSKRPVMPCVIKATMYTSYIISARCLLLVLYTITVPDSAAYLAQYISEYYIKNIFHHIYLHVCM